MNYSKSIGIFGDLVGLEDLPSRGHHLGRLRILLDKINATFGDKIKVDFTIINDTEFKGAFDRNFPLQDFLVLYNEEFGKDIGTHMGIGLGALGDPEEKEPGGCFFSARKAMAKAKENGKFIVFHGFEMNEAISALFYFIHEMDEGMTDRQRKVVEVYRKSGDISTVSTELYLPKQGVFDSIKAAKYEIFTAAWCGLEKLIKFDVKLPAAEGFNQQRPQRRDHQRSSYNDQQRPPRRDYQRPSSHTDQQRPPRRDYQRPSSPNDYQRPSYANQQRPPRRDYQRPSYNDPQGPPQDGYQQRPPRRDYQRPSYNDPQRPPQDGYQQQGPPQDGYQQRPPRRDYQPRPPQNDNRKPFGHDNRRPKRPDSRQRSGPSRNSR